MRFVKTLTVTARSTERDPSTIEARLIKGKLIHIEVAFPPGPGGYVSVVIRDGELQIAPANPEGSFSWDNFTHSFTMNYEMVDPPYALTLKGWSPDADYDHDIVFRFDVDTLGKDERELLLDRMTEGFRPFG